MTWRNPKTFIGSLGKEEKISLTDAVQKAREAQYPKVPDRPVKFDWKEPKVFGMVTLFPKEPLTRVACLTIPGNGTMHLLSIGQVHKLATDLLEAWKWFQGERIEADGPVPSAEAEKSDVGQSGATGNWPLKPYMHAWEPDFTSGQPSKDSKLCGICFREDHLYHIVCPTCLSRDVDKPYKSKGYWTLNDSCPDPFHGSHAGVRAFLGDKPVDCEPHAFIGMSRYCQADILQPQQTFRRAVHQDDVRMAS